MYVSKDSSSEPKYSSLPQPRFTEIFLNPSIPHLTCAVSVSILKHCVPVCLLNSVESPFGTGTGSTECDSLHTVGPRPRLKPRAAFPPQKPRGGALGHKGARSAGGQAVFKAGDGWADLEGRDFGASPFQAKHGLVQGDEEKGVSVFGKDVSREPILSARVNLTLLISANECRWQKVRSSLVVFSSLKPRSLRHSGEV